MTESDSMDLDALAVALATDPSTVRRWLGERAAVSADPEGLPRRALASFSAWAGEKAAGRVARPADLALWRLSLEPGDAAAPGLSAALDTWLREFIFWLGRAGERVELASELLGVSEAFIRGEENAEELEGLAAGAPEEERPPLMALCEELGVSRQALEAWYERFGRLFPHCRESLRGFAAYRVSVPSRPIAGAWKFWDPDKDQWEEHVPAEDRRSAARAFLAASGVVRLPVVSELLVRRGRAARCGQSGRERSAGFIALCGAMGLDPDIYACFRRYRDAEGAPGSLSPLFDFADWMTAHAPGRSPSVTDIRDWAADLGQDKGAASVSVRRGIVNAFCVWLSERGLIEGDFGRRRVRVVTEGPDVDPAPLCAAIGVHPATLEAWCREAGVIQGMDAPRLRGTLGQFGAWLSATGRENAGPEDVLAWREDLERSLGRPGSVRRIAVLRRFLSVMSQRGSAAAQAMLSGRRCSSGRVSPRIARILPLCPLIGVTPDVVERWIAEADRPQARSARRAALASFVTAVAPEDDKNLLADAQALLNEPASNGVLESVEEPGDAHAGEAEEPEESLSAADVTGWRDALLNGDQPQAVTWQRFATVRGFFQWLHERDLFDLPGLEGLGAGSARSASRDARIYALGALLGVRGDDILAWLDETAKPQARSTLRGSLVSLARYLHDRPDPAASLTAQNLSDWRARLLDEGRPAATVDARYRAAHRFFAWLADRGLFVLPGLAEAQAEPSQETTPSPEALSPSVESLLAGMGLETGEVDAWLRGLSPAAAARSSVALGQFAVWMAAMAPGRQPRGSDLEAWGRSLLASATRKRVARTLCDVSSFFTALGQKGLYAMQGLPGSAAAQRPSGAAAVDRLAAGSGETARLHGGRVTRSRTGENMAALCALMGVDVTTPARWREACSRESGRKQLMTGLNRLADWLAEHYAGQVPTASLIELWGSSLAREVSAIASTAYRATVRAYFAWLDAQGLFRLDRPLGGRV